MNLMLFLREEALKLIAIGSFTIELYNWVLYRLLNIEFVNLSSGLNVRAIIKTQYFPQYYLPTLWSRYLLGSKTSIRILNKPINIQKLDFQSIQLE